MKTLGGGSVALGAALTLFALTACPAFASGPHGGGGGGGSGSHSSSGGHFAAGGAHFSGSHYGGSHFAASAVNRGGYGVARGGGYGYAHASASVGRTVAAGYGRGSPGYAYARGGRYGGRWGGGYWHGGYWPPIFWGAGFAWFLPVLPAFCATYYWNSIPYYYYNDVYYTYDPAASGYVVTTPPPAEDPDAAASDSAGAGPAASAPGPAAPGPAPRASGGPVNNDGLFAYPKNGQSDEQQASDRSECAQWAGGQTGSNGAAGSLDYRRALTACLQGRGYSVD
jgi:hypothetical protein